MDKTKDIPDTRHLIRKLIALYPYRTAFVITALLIAGIVEAFGVATFIPLLSLLGGLEGSTTRWGEAAAWLFDFLNLPISLETVLSFILILISLKAVFLMIAMRSVGYAMVDMANNLRMRLIRALMKARWKYFNALPVGAITNSIGFETHRASRTYRSFCKIFADIAVVFAYLCTALLISWYLTLSAIVFSLVVMVALYKLVSLVKTSGRAQTRHMADLSTLISDFIGAVKIIKATGRAKFFIKLLQKEANNVRDSKKRQVIGNQALLVIREPIIVFIIVAGIYIASEYTSLNIANMMTFVFMFLRITQKITSLQLTYQRLVVDESAFWSVMNLIEESEKTVEKWPGDKQPELKKSIRFDSVSFRHSETDTQKMTLDNISAEFPAGEFTAVIGSSGAGKSTLVDLILGFHKPLEGQILIDDMALSNADISAWRQSIGYVPQECPLLHDTVYYNVSMGDEAISEEDAKKALEMAGAWDFVEKLPSGIDEIVGEKGQRFSGGQRQRIAIARAIVTNPKVLILDEATSALDKQTEKDVLDTVKSLSSDIIVIAISHDKAIQDYADRIYSISKGELEHVK